MTTQSALAMTPDQLLAKDSYAVCCFVDGEFAWIAGTYSSLGIAKDRAMAYRRATNSDYRVVEIIKQ